MTTITSAVRLDSMVRGSIVAVLEPDGFPRSIWTKTGLSTWLLNGRFPVSSVDLLLQGAPLTVIHPVATLAEAAIERRVAAAKHDALDRIAKGHCQVDRLVYDVEWFERDGDTPMQVETHCSCGAPTYPCPTAKAVEAERCRGGEPNPRAPQTP